MRTFNSWLPEKRRLRLSRGDAKSLRPPRLDIVFWLTAPNPYISQRLAELHRRGRVRFEVVYTVSLDEGRSWTIPEDVLAYTKWRSRSIAFQGKTIGVAPLRRLALKRPRIVFSFHGAPEVGTSFAVHAVPGVKLFYYVEKTFDVTVRRTKLKESAKTVLFRLADGFLTPGSDADAFVTKYAGATANIHRLDMVIDVDHFQRAATLRMSPASIARRVELGLQGTVFLNVGRLSFDKGTTVLLDAFEMLQKRGRLCSLLFVGDGVEREEYQQFVADRQLLRVVFQDFVQQGQLPDIYALGDVFVFPSRADTWGLVVDEAMAAGMPVISSLNVGEIQSRVKPGENGSLVPSENAAALAEAMEIYVENVDMVSAMGAQASRDASWRTIQHWCLQMEEFILADRGLC